jgi:hypothetical protein
MSDAIKKRMEELKEEEKLTDFQHTHLLCLNTIMDSLISIAESLKNIDQGRKLDDDKDKWRHTI